MTREQIHIGDMSHETAIGILKLMLEAMETYDGISPTPERINAVKMAIEALEQEPKSEWEHDHVILKAYSDGANDVLDKIRAEIEQTVSRYSISRERGCMGQIEWSDRLIKESEVLQILDKYKAETEEICQK